MFRPKNQCPHSFLTRHWQWHSRAAENSTHPGALLQNSYHYLHKNCAFSCLTPCSCFCTSSEYHRFVIIHYAFLVISFNTFISTCLCTFHLPQPDNKLKCTNFVLYIFIGPMVTPRSNPWAFVRLTDYLTSYNQNPTHLKDVLKYHF